MRGVDYYNIQSTVINLTSNKSPNSPQRPPPMQTANQPKRLNRIFPSHPPTPGIHSQCRGMKQGKRLPNDSSYLGMSDVVVP